MCVCLSVCLCVCLYVCMSVCVAPLVRIKQAMSKLREECQQMEIRTGVLQHVLLRSKLKEKSLARGVAANPDDDESAFRGF